MLDLKKMLTKISNKFKVETGNIAMTATTGTLTSCGYAKCGNIVYLNVKVSSARADAGSNLFVGKITNAGMLPAIQSNGLVVYSGNTFGVFLGGDGTLTIRNTSSTTIGASSTLEARISYIVNA